MNYDIDEKLLGSESDVEQKVIYPLLTNSFPIGLEFTPNEINTKLFLKKINIDKGAKAHNYYPDYVIISQGVPSLIIEAKKVGQDLNEAFREARLYATEINSMHIEEVNPCKFIIACDGKKLLAGYWNSQPLFEIETSSWNEVNNDFSRFIELFNHSAIKSHSKEVNDILRKNTVFTKPLFQLGGKYLIDQEINNSFGENIAIQYKHIFNPEMEGEKIDLVKNAYVVVDKHESHINPIDRLIRKKLNPFATDATLVQNTESPTEIIEKLKTINSFNNQVLLLIGSVGSGKSTFTTYLREVALDENLSQSLVWITIDLNNAPVSSEEIYRWLKKHILENLRSTFKKIDFDSLEIIKEVFEEDINKFEKLGGLLGKGSEKYNEELYKILQDCIANTEKFINGIIENFILKNNKNLIIVLDNCDKRTLQEQLLMFEVANWIKDSINCIVFLPLRDTTYDHFKNEKPLDTVVKDLTFRIIPASLEKILYSRIKYATRLNEKLQTGHYFLDNGMKVFYPKSEEIYYLRSILKSLFQNNFFKKTMIALAGSDIRIGIEIFLDFCKSGHISDSEIFKIKQSGGNHELPNHLISRIFLRGKKVYYKDENSRLRNLFNSDPADRIPNPFCRIVILRWLKDKYREKGPTGILGFHSVNDMNKELARIGFDKKNIFYELKFLIRQKLIISETQDVNNIDNDDLISITTSGRIHLEMIYNVDYISSCSEDSWFNNNDISLKIRSNMLSRNQYAHLSRLNTLENAEEFSIYLSNYFDQYFKKYSDIFNTRYSKPIDYQRIADLIDNSKFKEQTNGNLLLENGSIKIGTINNIETYGLFINLPDSKYVGFIESYKLKGYNKLNFDIGEKISVQIIKFNTSHNKYELELYDESKT
ncbi:type I restriction endonuclease [uncultured Chryseobacterium sp.]|uniref:type I restriction endonuclease n=1 Tax=uncultured Chryseobacterium sp. TaxID=259322 RepID=UPI0025E73CEE|nr:type I restriction endonuclease [uncultured Chryseobacterium sp.]